MSRLLRTLRSRSRLAVGVLPAVVFVAVAKIAITEIGIFHSIRETSFVVAGFLVAALTSLLLVSVLLFIDVGSLGTDLVLLCTLTFLLVYVLLLIRDLDNPFEHGVGRGGGSAEVSLEPLVGLNARLASERPG